MGFERVNRQNMDSIASRSSSPKQPRVRSSDSCAGTAGAISGVGISAGMAVSTELNVEAAAVPGLASPFGALLSGAVEGAALLQPLIAITPARRSAVGIVHFIVFFLLGSAIFADICCIKKML
jgi:hypothetical protein